MLLKLRPRYAWMPLAMPHMFQNCIDLWTLDRTIIYYTLMYCICTGMVLLLCDNTHVPTFCYAKLWRYGMLCVSLVLKGNCGHFLLLCF